MLLKQLHLRPDIIIIIIIIIISSINTTTTTKKKKNFQPSYDKGGKSCFYFFQNPDRKELENGTSG